MNHNLGEGIMGSEAVWVASILSVGGVIATAILKFQPRNGHSKFCQAHSGIVQWMSSIDKRLDEIHTDVKALK